MLVSGGYLWIIFWPTNTPISAIFQHLSLAYETPKQIDRRTEVVWGGYKIINSLTANSHMYWKYLTPYNLYILWPYIIYHITHDNLMTSFNKDQEETDKHLHKKMTNPGRSFTSWWALNDHIQWSLGGLEHIIHHLHILPLMTGQPTTPPPDVPPRNKALLTAYGNHWFPKK